MFNRISAALVVVAAIFVGSGCGFATGPDSNTFEMTATTTPQRVEDLSVSPPIASYSMVTVVNLDTAVVYIGGPQAQELAVCADTALCGGTSFTMLGGNVWIRSDTGTVAGIQVAPVGR